MICSEREMKILCFLFIEIYFLSKLCIRQKNSCSEMRFNEHTLYNLCIVPFEKKKQKEKIYSTHLYCGRKFQNAAA